MTTPIHSRTNSTNPLLANNAASARTAATAANAKERAASWRSAMAGTGTAGTTMAPKSAARGSAVATSAPTSTKAATSTSSAVSTATSTSTAKSAKEAAATDTTSPSVPKTEFELHQEYLANMRQLMATQGAGYIYTGPNTMANGGNAAAYLPSAMLAAGITPGQAVLDNYALVTGLDKSTASATPPTLDTSTGRYLA